MERQNGNQTLLLRMRHEPMGPSRALLGLALFLLESLSRGLQAKGRATHRGVWCHDRGILALIFSQSRERGLGVWTAPRRKIERVSCHCIRKQAYAARPV